MEKNSFKGVLCLLAGIILGIFFVGMAFRVLHLVGYCLMLWDITPILMAIEMVCLGCYVLKYGALNALIEQGNSAAKHLKRIEGIAFFFVALACLAVMFRLERLAGSGLMVMASAVGLSILSLLAGIFACTLYKTK